MMGPSRPCPPWRLANDRRGNATTEADDVESGGDLVSSLVNPVQRRLTAITAIGASSTFQTTMMWIERWPPKLVEARPMAWAATWTTSGSVTFHSRQLRARPWEALSAA
uniref:Uncharacterized protein n=1 Tax=Oryza sativa subsp. japonica TaxID=39947 RepID=Q6EN72_ORYSJ|nr:hypothetical protein [Oryza sativa Japonica Group]BAD29663.1 hypothetical protein [Oryza sativa Japonica Group]